jgi:hypothetical protein
MLKVVEKEPESEEESEEEESGGNKCLTAHAMCYCVACTHAHFCCARGFTTTRNGMHVCI